MALFQVSVLKKYLKLQDEKIIEKAYNKFTSYFQHPEIQENIRKSKEEQFQATFLSELFVNILGYKLNPNPNYNLTTEFKNESNNRKADGAILQQGNAIGVIELKGTNTKHLEGIRQQAFDYKANQKNCVYVITSNFEKLRFYINDATEFLEFDLFELNRDDFRLLWLCLHHDNIMNGLPLKIKEASLVEEEGITKEFYKDYSVFKRELYRDLVKKNAKEIKEYVRLSLSKADEDTENKNALRQAQGDNTDHDLKFELSRLEKNVKLNLFKKSQKLIDRFLFIFFAEDRGLLPPNSIHKIIQNWEMLQDMDVEQSLYERYKLYFNYLNTGREARGDQAEIFAYNGGLFKPDPILDMLKIDNELLLKHTKKLATYDFESQVDVNILGHIFENSLNEIESVNAEIEGADFDKQKSKRKKDGVFYTPKYITKYIVENTVGRLCEEKKTELGFREEEYFKGRKRRQRSTLEGLLKILDDYRNWLLKLRICDPACGSGAFLNQALDFLIKEHHYIDEMRSKLLGESFRFPGIENTILENNIYGVDINEESVEIARLSLWLRTARPHRKLNDLSNNIKCGNSLIDDKKVAGDKACVWENEFPEVFNPVEGSGGGFDVVIGNPPYGSISEKRIKEKLLLDYLCFKGNTDLYSAFIELSSKITKFNGFWGLIIPVSWQSGDNYKNIRIRIKDTSELRIGIKLPYDVFQDAYVDTGVYIFRNKSNKNYSSKVLEFGAREKYDSVKTLPENMLELPSKSWSTLPNLKIVLNPFFYEIQPKLKSNSITLDKISNSIRGILPRKQDVKNVYQNGSEKFFQGYLGRYYFENKFLWVDYGDHLREKPKDFSFFQGKRILIRRLINRQFRIMATTVENVFVNKKDIYNLKINDSKFSINYILTIINSKLISFTKTKGSTTASKDDFSQLTLSDIRSIPIKVIDRNAQKLFEENGSNLIVYIEELEEIKRKFLNYLKSQFPINKFSKKFQHWYELEFSEFIKELNKAIKKTNRERAKEGLKSVKELSKKDEFEWMELFEENRKKALELQEQINETDKKIDQMVYELYGLTEEEIQIVENS